MSGYAVASIFLIIYFKSVISAEEWLSYNEFEKMLYLSWIPILGILVPFIIGRNGITGEGAHEVYAPIITLLVILIIGSTMLYETGAEPVTWWPFYLAIGVVSVICTFSLALSLGFCKEKKAYEKAAINHNDKEAVERFGRRLELTHDTYKTLVQVIFSLLGIFFISGVIAVTFNEKILEQLGTDKLNDAAFIVLTSSFWGLAGIWFGIIGPILGHMDYLREKMYKASNGGIDS